jgi:hypothetical protein
MAKKKSTTKPKPASKGMLKAVKQSLKSFNSAMDELRNVLPSPPEWLPVSERKRFSSIIIPLLDAYPASKIKEMISQRERMFPLSAEAEDKIDALIDYKQLVSLGEKEGMNTILGDERSKNLELGVKNSKAVKAGGLARQQERLEDWKKYQEHINKLHAEFPHYSYSRLKRMTGRKFKTSLSTLKRRTSNPQNKS